MKFEAAGSATWSVDITRQKETPAEGRGSKTSLGSVTLFPPREAFFLTHPRSLPNWHCDSCWWTACRLSLVSFLSSAISITPPVAGFVLQPLPIGASAENGASNHFQTSETPVHRASPHRSSCAIQRCSSVVILLATTTSRHLLLNCRQGDLPSEADHPRPPLSLPRSNFYSTVNLSLRVSPASRSQVQDRVIRPALHRQITRAKPTTSASKSLQRS